MDTRMPTSSFTQRPRARWFGAVGVLLVVLTIGMAVPLDRLWISGAATAAPDVIAPKVLTVTMFQTGDPLAGGQRRGERLGEERHAGPGGPGTR